MMTVPRAGLVSSFCQETRMTCPNGHTGGVFCCEDNVNAVFAAFYERYKTYEPSVDRIPVTLEHLDAYVAFMKKLMIGAPDDNQAHSDPES